MASALNISRCSGHRARRSEHPCRRNDARPSISPQGADFGCSSGRYSLASFARFGRPSAAGGSASWARGGAGGGEEDSLRPPRSGAEADFLLGKEQANFLLEDDVSSAGSRGRGRGAEAGGVEGAQPR